MLRYGYNAFRHAVAALICAVPALAQEAVPAAPAAAEAPVFGWKRQATGLLNLSQTYLDNWAKGGTDALSWNINLAGVAVLEQETFIWESNAKVIYGQTKIDDLASRKSQDEWKVESIYTRKLGTWVNPFAAVTGWSQFTAGYDYDDDAGTRTLTSEFFDPAFFTQTLGVGITPIPDLKERLGFALKQTFSSEHGYADDPDTEDEVEEFSLEYGLSSITEYQFSLMENILANTKLDVFVNFQGVDAIDGRWENKITAKVNKWVSANFELEMLYDKDLSDSYQLRETLGIGISFLTL
jgi:hypothetical protein